MQPFPNHLEYVLRLGDSALILAQRLTEWCGHGPILEQDIALSNIALDLLGQAQNLLAYAGELENQGRTADQLAFTRDAHDFRNVFLAELPNGDWAQTLLRQFFYDAYSYYVYEYLVTSSDNRLAEIAAKALKEVTYHLRYSSEWVIRLGDGTEESRQRMLDAYTYLWPYVGELISPDEVDKEMQQRGIGPDVDQISEKWKAKVLEVLEEATLGVPDFSAWMQKGAKQGHHTENLGYILAEMQYLQRAYPNLEW